jgi:hypothetical protein
VGVATLAAPGHFLSHHERMSRTINHTGEDCI